MPFSSSSIPVRIASASLLSRTTITLPLNYFGYLGPQVLMDRNDGASWLNAQKAHATVQYRRMQCCFKE